MQFHYQLDDIFEAARRFWNTAGDARVFAFEGEMGAGKTTFIHALCAAKGIRDTSSPTFSIINEYEFFEGPVPRRIYHMDLYRLNSTDEAIQAGVEECLYGDGICLVEWPEKTPGIFPAETVTVRIAVVDSTTRSIQIERN